MDMDDGDVESDVETSKRHSKLVSAISRLDQKQRVKPPVRKESSVQVSEFHLSRGGISVNELAKVLGKGDSSQALIGRKLQSAQRKAKTLSRPVEKIVSEKVKRKTGFENTKKLLSRWDAVVTSNKVADQLQFPLPTKSHLKAYESMPTQDEDGEKEGNKAYPLSIEEILFHRQENARLKAKTAQQQIKAWRQNKIKSKKYHRVLRKEKMRQQIKEFETLKVNDPEKALKQLEQLERTRAQERASLRHRNTGHWARNKAIHAKYDRECRQELAQQLSISRELTQKIQSAQESSESDDEEEEIPDLILTTENALSNQSQTDEASQFFSGYRKFWEQKNALLSEKKLNASSDEIGIKQPTSAVSKNSPQIEDTKSSNGDVIYTNDRKVKVKKSGAKKSPKRSSGTWTVTDDDVDPDDQNSATKELVVLDDDNFLDMFTSAEVEQDKRINSAIKKLSKELKRTPNKGTLKVGRNEKKRGKKLNESGEEEVVPEKFPTSLRGKKEKRAPHAFPLSESALDEVLDENTRSNILRSTFAESTDVGLSQLSQENIDPSKFLEAKPLKSSASQSVVAGLEDLDNMEEAEEAMHHSNLAEAFADDDVVDEFRQEKSAAEKASQPKEIDLTLPGWGSWAGSGLEENKRKRKRFILKPVVEAPRKDRSTRNVIINETKDTGIANHQVNDLPYPFESVKDFEASIRAPIGNTWVPETAHRKLTAPRVVVQQGQVIRPMTEEVLTEMDGASS